MNIFEQLDLLLLESEGKPKTKESDIPIHPEMETKEQGRIAVAEEYVKIFQKLSGGSSGDAPEEVKDSRPSLPDSIIDPSLKDATKKSKEKTFEKNKVVGWDEKFDEKIKKDVDMEDGDSKDDEFDDFDYRDNKFGDDEDNDEMNPEGEGESGGESGGSGGESGGSGGESGGESGGSHGGESGSSHGGSHGGESGGSHGGSEADKHLKDAISRAIDSIKNAPKSDLSTTSKKRLDDLKDAINSDDKDIKDINDKIEDIKNKPDETEIPGTQIENPSDSDVRDDMKKSGLDDESIDKIIKEKNIDSSKDYNEDEIEKMKEDAVDSLVGSAEEKGKATSALASSIVRHSLKQTIVDGEWRTLLQKFLHAKSVVNKGNMSTSNKGVGWNTKTHAYRGLVTPRIDAESKSSIRNIYCFIDFSGSCSEKLVYSFLGKVVDLAFEKLKYTKVHIYGFANNLTPCTIIDDKSLRKGKEEAFKDAWKFISGNITGGAIENFMDVAVEIKNIKRKENDAVILIFGDAEWPEYKQAYYEPGITFKYKSKTGTVGPICLKNVLQKRNLDDICVLAYYTVGANKSYTEYSKGKCYSNIEYLRKIVGIKNIIVTGSNMLT